MNTIETNDGARLKIEEHPGREPAMVFLHGWANNTTIWHPVVSQLHNHCVLYDLRGHGESTTGTAQLSMQRLVKDYKTVTETIDSEPIPIGHSLGGMILLHTDLPRKTVLIDTTADAVPTISSLLAPALRRLGKLFPKAKLPNLGRTYRPTHAFIEGWRHGDADTIANCIDIMQDNPAGLQEHKHSVEPLLIRGRYDQFLLSEHHEAELRSQFDTYQETYLNTTHHPHIEAPSQTARAIHDYINE